MQLAGEYTFDAPQALVWKALRDPEVLGTIMPGGEGFTEVAENQFVGNLSVKVGPVQGKFQGSMVLSDIVEPESYKINVDGKGPQGFVKATGRLHLTPQGDQTHMKYEGDAQIGGRIASVGQRLIDTSAKSIIRQALEGLNQYLKFQVATGAATTTAAADATPPEPAEAIAPVDPPPAVMPTEYPQPTEALPAEPPVRATAAVPAEPAIEPMAPALSVPPPTRPTPTAPTPIVSTSTVTTPTPTAAPVFEYKPPSQTEVAMNVAKDVAADLIPSRYRPILIAVVIILILLIIYLILT